MAERPTSPVVIARELNLEPSLVGYHARKLEVMNLIEKVDERPKRGAIEHLYRTVNLSVISDEEWADLDEERRRVWVETAFSFYGIDLLHSLEEGTLLGRDDFFIARTSMKVDKEGWEAIRDSYAQHQEHVEAIKAESETRLAVEDTTPIPILSFLSLFEMPPPKA